MKQPRWSWTENNGNVHGSLRWWEIQDKSTINCWLENDKSTIQDKSTINPLPIHYQSTINNNGGFVRLESHRTKWWIFRQAMFDYWREYIMYIYIYIHIYIHTLYTCIYIYSIYIYHHLPWFNPGTYPTWFGQAALVWGRQSFWAGVAIRYPWKDIVVSWGVHQKWGLPSGKLT